MNFNIINELLENMKTKIVYVLSSNDSDIFLEQILLSSYSLKLYNPNCHAVLVVDENTEKNIIDQRIQIMSHIDERIVVNIPFDLSKKEASRFLKTTLREHIHGDYLFLDGDTIICQSLAEIDNCPYDVAAVLDRHNYIHEGLISEFSLIGHSVSQENDKLYFNSGVMYVKDTKLTHNLYKAWYQNWNEWRIKKNICIDQPTLAKVNSQMGFVIKELSGIWNCQILGNGLKFLHEAYIIHFYNSSVSKTTYYFSNPDIYRKIKADSYIIPNEIRQKVRNSKSAFASECQILADEELNLYRSRVVRFIFAQYYYHKQFYRFLVRVVALCEKIMEIIRRLKRFL